MESELERFDREWREGSRDVAKQIAKRYVDQHRGQLSTVLAKCTREDLVAMVSAYRNVGREEDRIVVDMWLLSEYEPQIITGSLKLGGSE